MRVVLDSVQQYTTIVDTASSAHPIAALVWSSIKIVVQAAMNFASYFEKLSKRFALLSTYCPRLSAYEKLFKESTRLQTSLSDFYALVVKFCAKALEVIQKKGVKRFVNSLWKDFKSDFGQLEENISAAKVEVDEEIRLASEQKIQQIHEQLLIESEEAQIQRSQQLTEIEESKDFRSQQTLALAKTEELHIQKLIKEEDRTRIRLHKQVFNYDYTRSQNKACRTRCQGTAVWLFERTEFREWNEGVLPMCLWCSGITGCGKTILTGHVVEWMTKGLASQKDTRIAYYFFDSAQKESLLPGNFLRSILHQLLCIESLIPALQRRLEAIFMGLSGTYCREPEIDELETLVLDMCDLLQKTIILIDGINEMEQDNRKLVMRFLKSIQQNQAVIKLFITSRPDVDLLKIFSEGQLTRINIQAQDTRAEIENFVNTRVDKEAKNGPLAVCGPAVIDEIKKTLNMKAKGMFLWVDLQVKAICDTCEDDETSDRIPEVLEKLPEGIIDIYSHALQKVLRRRDEEIECVKKIFKWVACARRPMTIDELHGALTTSTGQTSWKKPSQKFSPSTVSKLCGNLIVYDGFDKTLSLAHHTVQAVRRIKQLLKRSSLLFSWQPWSLPDDLDPFPHWSMFLWAVRQAHIPLLEIWQEFVTRKEADGSWRRLWFASGDSLFSSACIMANTTQIELFCDSLTTVRPAIKPSQQQLLSGIVTAAALGHITVIEILLRQNTDVNVAPASRNGRTALQSAAAGGHLLVVERLLQQNADVNAPVASRFGRTALQAAAEGGHLVVVEKLLQQNADVNAPAASEYGRTALQAAAESGHLAVVEKLLQQNAYVNAAPAQRRGRTALQAAAGGGHPAVVERLLQQNANVNAFAASRDGRTALQAAAEGGHLAIVENLLQQNADVNAPATLVGGRSALQAATGGGHLAVVERLLQQNADVNAPAASRFGRTALQAAAEGGHLVLVEKLLQQNADVNAPAASEYGRAALQAAAESGHLAVVEKLLQQNAHVNAAPAQRSGRTALQAAAGGGHSAVVERLLQQNANVNAFAASRDGRTALQAAAEGGHLAVVEKLLQQNADVNVPAARYNGRTALQAAAEGGHLAVVEKLLQQNADVNAPAAGYYGRTALQAAANGGHQAVFERLRAAGAIDI
ncbi:hypothetical protein MMC29_002356 [Sticta canariensis]|nr:hypothetical protein [Sticta canariensis]